MSVPFSDQKEQQQTVTAMEAGQVSDPPTYEGGATPCRFRGGGRRGRCHRRARLSFMQRFSMLFVTFSTVSFIYTLRSSIYTNLQPGIDFVASWFAGPYSLLKTLADIPFQLHPYFGLVFYSALAAFVLTSLKMRLMQKRKARMQRWLANSAGHRDGQGERHHHHHHRRHAHFAPQHTLGEVVGQYLDDEKVTEQPVLVAVQRD